MHADIHSILCTLHIILLKNILFMQILNLNNLILGPNRGSQSAIIMNYAFS